MTYPWAVATILTYCAGTDGSCGMKRPEGMHLFRVSENVIRFDVHPDDTYELVLPANKENRWGWLCVPNDDHLFTFLL